MSCNFCEKIKEVPSSTPNNFPLLSRRRPIHPKPLPSPIKKSDGEEDCLPKLHLNETNCDRLECEYHSKIKESFSRSDSSTKSVNRQSRSSFTNSKNEVLKGSIMMMIGGGLIMITCSVFALVFGAKPFTGITIKDLQTRFPSQSEELWTALESGIQEVVKLNKPSVFIFVYEKGSEETVNNLTMDMAQYVECVLNNNCKIEPVILTSDNVNLKEAIDDYGYIITKYKHKLEDKSVMVVKDLDRVSGKVAQAFHSMCDEYTPLIKKAVYFFTIKIVKDGRKHDVEVVEDLLRKCWDLDDDIFEPLFTRISNMVLQIFPENEKCIQKQ